MFYIHILLVLLNDYFYRINDGASVVKKGAQSNFLALFPFIVFACLPCCCHLIINICIHSESIAYHRHRLLKA